MSDPDPATPRGARPRQLPLPVLAAALLLWAAPGATGQEVHLHSADLGALRARAIGPAVMGGRIAALDAVPGSPLTIYVGTAGGGVWKSRDGGTTFKPIFDDHAQSIGAITIDPAYPDTVWVGTGESWTRNSVSVGTGVYRTTDGGESWKRVGLEDSERIARIRVDPTDGKTVYVCATGHLWDANQERGVYRTRDGGKKWERVLFVDENTGCSDLAIDPQDPRILYAGMWQFRRWPWSFRSGGPGSGLYRSTDGGEHWTELTQGLPEGEKGRIAVGVALSRPNVVYTLVEAKKTALYRSDNLGETWRKVSDAGTLAARPFYFANVIVDPSDFNRVYKPGLSLFVSDDGGKSFSTPSFGGTLHSDLHALWIDPSNPERLLAGTDGGLYISRDRGGHWRLVKALPISQFYHVSYDMEWPYHVYGGLQDNGTWTGPSRSVGGIRASDWSNIGSGDGFHAFVDPRDPDFVYVEWQGGNLVRYRKSTGEHKDIKPYSEDEAELRFNWNAAVHVSPSQRGTLYLGAQYLYRSADRGESWERISPDLTTNDPHRQRQAESGGLTIDNTSAENYTTIYSISESPRNASVIWVGTDDGNLQLTRDGAASWNNVVENVPDLPPRTWVSHVEASPHDEATAFVTFDGHRTGDMATYVYRTSDFGRTWTSLAADSVEGYAHVVKQDLENPELLFLGTEFGLFVSLDGGKDWARFKAGLPRVAVRDLAIHPREGDLIIATHGRGVYILDDLTPLRALTPEILAAEAALLPSRPAAMVLPSQLQDFPGDAEFAGSNPPEAADIVYYLKKRHIFGDLRVEVYGEDGKLISTLPGSKRRGLNRVRWPMRLRPPKVPPANTLVPAFIGPRLPEGTYTVRLVKGDSTYEGSVSLVADPRSPHSAEDRRLQQETTVELYRLLEDLAYAVDVAVDVRDQARSRAAKLGSRSRTGRRLTAFADRLDAYRAGLVSSETAGLFSGEEKLREHLAGLYGSVAGYDGRPSQSQLARARQLAGQVGEALERFARLREDLQSLNSSLERRGVAPLRVRTREEWNRS